MKNPIQLEDIFALRFPSDVRLSPDGRTAAFVVTQGDLTQNKYLSYIHVVDTITGEERRLTGGGSERAPLWLDKTTLLFSAARDKKEGEKGSRFYRIDLRGGEAELAFTTDDPASGLMKLPDGRFILTVKQPCEAPEEEKDGEAKRGKDYEIFEELPFWMNGAGIVSRLRNRLVILDPATGNVDILTPPFMAVGETALSPDGTRLVYTAREYRDVRPAASALYLLDIASRTTRLLFAQEDRGYCEPAFLDNDRLFLGAMTFEWSGRNPHRYTYTLSTGTLTPIDFPDADIGAGCVTDASYGGGQSEKAVHGALYFGQLKGSNGYIRKRDEKGVFSDITTKAGAVPCFDTDGDTFVFIAFRDGLPAEVFTLDGSRERRLTHLNDAYVMNHEVAPIHTYTVTLPGGPELEGVLLYPRDYRRGQKYPAILEIHGGPKGASGPVFHHEMQAFSSAGYFTFITNPRGADGRGEDFANLTGKMGTIDRDDILRFLDGTLALFPDIDENRVAICGGSYGGFMCNRLIGHTQRFAPPPASAPSPIT